MITVKVLGDYIQGKFLRPRGAERKIISRDPGDVGYRIGSFPLYPQHADQAVEAARLASAEWRRLDSGERANFLRKFSAEVVNHRRELSEVIAAECGKPLWEAQEEVKALEAQVEIEIREGVRFVSPFKVREVRMGVEGRCSFRSLGVVAVLGSAVSPLQFSSAHIIPALLSGNTVVFKPSKLVPACGQLLARLFDIMELPPGVFNLVQGDAATGMTLAAHPNIDAVLFTGSYPTGRRILQATSDQPHKLVSLQLGGNNVALVLADADLNRALHETISGAFLTTGQRYSSTRIILVDKAVFSRFSKSFVEISQSLKVGYAFDREVFMGPMLSESAKERVLDLHERLSAQGCRLLMPRQAVKVSRPGHYLAPATYVLEKPNASSKIDGLFFGPQVVLIPVEGEEEALRLANSSDFGFSAAVFTEDAKVFDRYEDELRFGLINWNLATTDITMRLPLHGFGKCGNHRPAGVFSQRNCTFPVATLACGSAFDPDASRPVFPRFDPL